MGAWCERGIEFERELGSDLNLVLVCSHEILVDNDNKLTGWLKLSPLIGSDFCVREPLFPPGSTKINTGQGNSCNERVYLNTLFCKSSVQVVGPLSLGS